MRDKLFVFISSSMREFSAEREAIRKTIERALPLSRAWTFESAPADSDSLQESYLKHVRDCDIFVLLVGSDISDPVRLEYETAKSSGIPRLVFVNQFATRTKRADDFLNSLDIKWKTFSSLRSLQQEVIKAIVSLLIDYSSKLRLSTEDIEILRKSHRFALLGVRILAVTVVVLLIGFFLALNFAGQTLNENASLKQTIIVQQPTAIALQATIESIRLPSFQGSNLFGYGAQLNWTNNDNFTQMAQLNQLGFNWGKVQIRWCDVEQQRGNIDFSVMNRLIATANAKGIRLLFTVVCAPKWSRRDGGAGGAGPPDNMQDAADFMSNFAGTYCNKGLGAIEVWNEQNLLTEWHGKPVSAAIYMDMLQRSYKAIKARCPSVIVVSGAPTPTGVKSDTALDDLLYLQQLYQYGLKQYSDAIGAHPNGFCNAPDATIGLPNQCGDIYNNHRSFYFRGTMEAYRALMVTNGDGSKQVWPTEFGWASDVNPKPGYEYAKFISPDQQAQWIVAAYQLMKSWGWVGTAILWNLDFTDMGNETGAFHILGRPAFDALSKMPK